MDGWWWNIPFKWMMTWGTPTGGSLQMLMGQMMNLESDIFWAKICRAIPRTVREPDSWCSRSSSKWIASIWTVYPHSGVPANQNYSSVPVLKKRKHIFLWVLVLNRGCSKGFSPLPCQVEVALRNKDLDHVQDGSVTLFKGPKGGHIGKKQPLGIWSFAAGKPWCFPYTKITS